ncbi:hypothetical protein ECANGB1_1686 [Enterospora canceri]|uniref:Uncharacterized protein n=1 Tax=Enterospora canceri TaxID=1081671 RepID=A0A1Y1S920_9MICR|nr:hypothetical protein ECANGB1_1686 [Enterospora canceri]
MLDDFVDLSLKIKKDPSTYVDEYIKKIHYTNSLLQLNKIPLSELKQVLLFIIRNGIRYKENAIRHHIRDIIYYKNNTTVFSLFNYKEKQPLLNELILLRKYEVITGVEFFDILIDNAFSCDKMVEYMDENVVSVLTKYYFSTDNCKTKRVTYYYTMKYLEKYGFKEELGNLLLDPISKYHPKITKYALLYFNDALDIKICDFDADFHNRLISTIYSLIVNCKDENIKLYVEIYTKLSNDRDSIHLDNIPVIRKLINQIDLNSHIALINQVIQKCDINEVSRVLRIIDEEMLNYREDDVVAQGMNLLREIYKRYMNTEQCKIKNEVLQIASRYENSKIRSVEFGYRSIINLSKKKTQIDQENRENDTEQESIEENEFKIHRKPTREEKETKRKEGQLRSKEKRKENNGNKKKNSHKKGRSKKSARSRLFKTKKKQ